MLLDFRGEIRHNAPMSSNEKYNLADLDEDDYETVLATDINFTGEIKFARPLMVKGKVSGKLESGSDLTIEESAVVHAAIFADRVIVKGEVVGNITAKTSVNVYASGRLTGDITSPEVVLEPGCFFSGSCTMQQ